MDSTSPAGAALFILLLALAGGVGLAVRGVREIWRARSYEQAARRRSRIVGDSRSWTPEELQEFWDYVDGGAR